MFPIVVPKTTSTVIVVVFLGIIAVLGFGLIIACIRVVPTNEIWTVERPGRSFKELRPEMHLLRKFDTHEVAPSIPERTAVTRGNVPVTVTGSVYYCVREGANDALLVF